MVHRLDQIPNTGNLRSGEMPQIVNANVLNAKGFQNRSQSVTQYLVAQMTSTANRREQKRIGIRAGEQIQMGLNVGADMRRHHNDSRLAALRRVDPAARAMREGTANRYHFAAVADVFASKFP